MAPLIENTKLISGGVNYFLNGSRSAYSGSGSPWTVQGTTPFLLSLNDETPAWTPGPAPTAPILGGGPPFRMGKSLIAKSYDTVQETVGIQIYATSYDNGVVLLRLLRQVLNTTLLEGPCILAVQPPNATNIVYSEILYADVAETLSYLKEKPSGKFVFRAVITWVRTIGSAGALTTLINAVTVENRSSGSPDNVESLGTPAGDLINEGQPLNLLLVPATSFQRLYLATVYERINTSVTSTKTTSTNAFFTNATPTVTNARNRSGLKVRIIARLDTFTNPSKIRLQANVTDATGGFTIKNLAQIALPSTAAASTLVDLGWIDVTPIRSVLSASLSFQIGILLSSSDGTSVTARLDYVETLLYYTFCSFDNANIGSPEGLYIEQANDFNVNGIVVPSNPARTYRVTPTAWKGNPTTQPRGTLPKAIAGASLWLGWLKAVSVQNDTHTTTDTLTLTASQLPMAHTLR